MKRAVTILILLVISAGRLTHPVLADELDLSISPPLVEILTPPGSLVKTAITLTNHTEKTLGIRVGFKTFQQEEEGGSIKLGGENEVSQIQSWLHLEKNNLSIQNEFELRSKEETQLTLFLDIPKEASSSDHYVAIIFEAKKKNSTASGDDQIGATIQASVAQLLLLSIDTTPSPSFSASLKEFFTQRLFLGDPIAFRLLITNQGNHFLNTKGEITVTDIQNQTVATIPIAPQIVLARASKNLGLDTKTISSKNLFGKYKAEAKIDIGDGKELHEEFTFYVLPKNATIIVLIVFAFFAWVSRRFHLYAKWRQGFRFSKSQRH